MPEPLPSGSLVHSVKEGRRLLGNIAQPTIYKLINSGELRTIKIAGRRFIPHSAILELIGDGPDAA